MSAVDGKMDRFERREKVLDLYSKGHSQREIAAMVGWSEGTVWNDLKLAGSGRRSALPEAVQLELLKLPPRWQKSARRGAFDHVWSLEETRAVVRWLLQQRVPESEKEAFLEIQSQNTSHRPALNRRVTLALAELNDALRRDPTEVAAALPPSQRARCAHVVARLGQVLEEFERT